MNRRGFLKGLLAAAAGAAVATVPAPSVKPAKPDRKLKTTFHREVDSLCNLSQDLRQLVADDAIRAIHAEQDRRFLEALAC